MVRDRLPTMVAATLVAVVSVVAGACASDTAGPSATTGSEPTTGPPVTVRGVDDDTIEIGVAFVDFEQLVSMGVFGNTHGDEEAIWEALLDDLNERGGINGRDVVGHYSTYTPIGPTEAEATCIELTEDHEVFAVLGLWVGETILCVTDTHDTPYIGHMPTQEMTDRSRAVLASPDANPERMTAALLQVLDTEGVLDGATVAILADPTTEAEADEIVAFLDQRGVAMGTVVIMEDNAGDITAGEAQVATFVERWRTEDLTTMFYVGNNSHSWVDEIHDGLGPLQTISNRPEVARQVVSSSGRPDAFEGMLVINGLDASTREQYDEPLLQECMQVVVAAVPELDEVTPPGELGDEVVDWYTGIRDACSSLAVFEAAAVAAGPELTNDSLRAGLEGLGTIGVPGKALVSFGPGKWDGEDGFRLYRFDTGAGPDGAFVARGDIVDVSASG